MILPDVTGDQKLDIITSNSNDGTIGLRSGDGAGGFAAGFVNFNVGVQPTSVAVADLSGDGLPDIIVGNQGDGTVSVLTGKGGGAFGLAAAFTMNSQSASVDVGDVKDEHKLWRQARTSPLTQRTFTDSAPAPRGRAYPPSLFPHGC